jgi:hypothetical protein
MAQFTPKIPIASVAGGDPELTIADADWEHIQKAYGTELLPEMRKQIYEATNDFLRFVKTEYSAQPVSAARHRVKRIKKAAADFQEAIFEYSQSDVGDATLYANHLINRSFDDPRVKNRDKLRFLSRLMTSFAVACNRALSHLDNPTNRGRREGETWENWVRKLTRILDATQLPTKVRKDSDKNITKKPSPFVALVRELQKCIPKEYRRSQAHSASLEANIALSEAIVRARRLRRSTKSSPTWP